MKTRNDLLWSISLFVIGIATIILAGLKIVGVELPDVLIRIIGIVNLISLPVLTYNKVIKVKRNKK